MTNHQPIGGIQHDIVQFVAHENFNEDTYSYDIAIIQVTPCFDFSNPKVTKAELNLGLNYKPSNHIHCIE